MSKRKTWIKIKRGLITDPKHRKKLGIRIWLFLYMLDIVDWPSGFVLEWTDRAAADELRMPIDTIRKQRRHLEQDEYITCHQIQHYQEIEIHKWIDPRKYSGEVINQGDQNRTPHATDEGDRDSLPPDVAVVETDHPDEGGHQGDHQGCHQGIVQLATLPIKPTGHISHIREESSKSLDQTPWIETLSAICATHYRGNHRSRDFQRYWQPTEFIGHENGVFQVKCESDEQREWLDARKNVAEKMIIGVLGKKTEIEFISEGA